MEKEPELYLLSDALRVATLVKELLAPHCERIEIAGSIRRECPGVKDIEIVCIPKPYDTGLFESGLAKEVNTWKKVKGEMEYGKCRYTQRILPEGIKLDLFMCRPENWGLIFAIRTGSANFSHHVLASAWARRGYECIDGMLTQDGKQYEVREEAELFWRLGMKFVEPKDRK